MHSASLPAPGTIWKHRPTNRLMRVVLTDEFSICAHNAELAAREPKLPMVSWLGDPDTFARAFRPADPDQYPPTAN